MPLSIGDKLGPYEVLARIGAGGMGEVWKARDTRLQRTVAIKVLPAHLSSSPNVQARFEHEAKSISKLQHPNICVVHDIGSQDGVDFMVMEYLAGQTLESLIPPGGLTADLVIRYAVQIAEALAAAHAAGMVHRDLKPANIMVDKSGLVKVLDFGLAKLAAPAFTADGADATTVLATVGTTPGMIVGTVAYMSPEQARGKELDGRSDLFSFGAVLYQMATGVAPFRGESTAVIFEALLNKTPPSVRERNPDIPVELERVIARLLEKDRDTRYQSAADVRADLKRVERDSTTGASGPAPKARGLLTYAMAAAVAVVLLAGGVFWWQRTHAKPLTDQDVLVMADFTNTTGDTAFDGALRQALAFDLEQSPFLKVMDDHEVNQTLHLMGRPAGQRITNDIAHEVCFREGQKATIGGSIASLGKTYQIALQAINCQTGVTLAREQAEAEDKEHVLKAVAKAATGMRSKLGESLTSIQKPDRSVDEEVGVTTTSLEALKAYQLGFDLINRASDREAIPQLQRAIELDPNFGSAYYFLGIAYGDTFDPVRQSEFLSKAFALADHVSERERLLISGDYYQDVTHEMSKALDAFQVLARMYPRDAGAHLRLAQMYSGRGEWEKALEEAQEMLRLAPRSEAVVSVAMRAYLSLDRFDEAKAVAEKAFSRKMDGDPIRYNLLKIGYIQDDGPTQEKQIEWYAGKPAASFFRPPTP
jgi:tetratricopeptide (TPR) repeat protein